MSDSHFLTGERIYLREVRLSDVNEIYCGWMNDPDVTQYLESRFYATGMKELQQYVERLVEDRNQPFFAICLKNEDRHIGNIKLGPINWIHRHADIGIIIGEKDCWKQGYATDAIKLMRDYAFGILNLHKLTAGCYYLNQSSVRAFEKAGFVVEGIRKSHYFCQAGYLDAVLLGIARNE